MAKKISSSVGKGGKNIVEDTSGQLAAVDSVADNEGNPAPSAELDFSAPPSSTTQTWAVAFPIGDEFVYDPTEFGPAVSLDFQLDVLAREVSGSSHVDITLAILQNESFLATTRADTPRVDGTQLDWTTLSQSGLRAEDFAAVDGGREVPDFSQPFQFGYAFTGEYSTTGLSVKLGIDNMEATVNTIPEPTSIALAFAMSAAVLWHRWWSNDGDGSGG
ncbi:hypothetical protein [Bythopirellula goksoeyrii]|uniref:PEP-CTERM protein-sorting domain-containing protein n=1 Tax=Bythopirellula goksoeyrii TaxID=1400387 RepID=A0A5B9Q2X1_9BACT|nr:hypothetical protein [Bythopirellula goksoeyrii]QEG33334.1 hypothetical protein Pr1d_05950 [Bythopirellula goksoeyrii]